MSRHQSIFLSPFGASKSCYTVIHNTRRSPLLFSLQSKTTLEFLGAGARNSRHVNLPTPDDAIVSGHAIVFVRADRCNQV